MSDFTYAQTVAKVDRDYLKRLKDNHTEAIKAQTEIINNLVHLKTYVKWLNVSIFDKVAFNDWILSDLEDFRGNMIEIYGELDEISSKHVDYLERMLKAQLNPQ